MRFFFFWEGGEGADVFGILQFLKSRRVSVERVIVDASSILQRHFFRYLFMLEREISKR